MQHLQLQKHEGLALQMQHLYIVPSCAYHTDVVIFGMDLLQSVYFQCMSAEHTRGHLLSRLDKICVLFPRNFPIQCLLLYLSQKENFRMCLTYISLSSYLAAKLCRTPGSCKYDSFVMSSTPPGEASVSFGNTLEIFATTCNQFSSNLRIIGL